MADNAPVTDIRLANSDDADAIAAVLVASFLDDPGAVIFEPDPVRRAAILPAFFGAWVRAAIADGGDLVVPANLTLVHLPPYSPELNPVERVWLYLRERWLSHRVLAGYDAVLDAACAAWNALRAEPGRVRSLTAFPWLPATVTNS